MKTQLAEREKAKYYQQQSQIQQQQQFTGISSGAHAPAAARAMDRQNAGNASFSGTQRQPGILQNLSSTSSSSGVTVRTQTALNGTGTVTQQGVPAPH